MSIVFRDYPLMVWLIGVMTVVLAYAVVEVTWERLLFALSGVAIIGFTSILTVAADHTRRTLSLHYRSLFRTSTKAYPFSEICFVNVVEDREGERMYRMELILRSGQQVPLRSWYSSGKARKERRAQRLRSVLGIGYDEAHKGSILRLCE